MSNVIGIPTTRLSDLYIYRQLQGQVSYNQIELFRLQTQLSTGYRITRPSEDPGSSMQIISLQRLLEQKEQVQSNLSTSQSFLTTTDSALSSVASLMIDVRATALEVLGTTATDTQRQTAAEQIKQAIQQLVDTGNQSFCGRYLFSGSLTMVEPFEHTDDGYVKYLGNERQLSTYCDVDLLCETNVTGAEVFGAISDPVRGSKDLNPILTYDTRLADLRGGRGISQGSIAISNGSQTSIVDLSSAETIGDVAALIRANPPAGSVVDVEITATGLEISLDAGNLSIKELGGGTTANELGILAKTGVGTGPVVGDDLDPVLRLTTRLENLLGVRAGAVLRSAGTDNDLIVEADRNGPGLNGVTVSFFDDGTVLAPGGEVVDYNPGAHTLQINIKSAYSNAIDVVNAINAAYDSVTSPFTARLDPLDDQNGGLGTVDVTATAVTRYGSGFDFDQDSGIQIVNGSETHAFTFSEADGVYTVEDLLNVLNGSDANVLAEINEDATGIDLRSRLSGADFAIGENGGTTATELGLRTFTTETRLEDLNFGLGVNDYEGTGAAATATKASTGENNNLVFTALSNGLEWNDFEIVFQEQVPDGAETLAYDPVAKTMVFSINPGQTTAHDIIELFEATPGVGDDFEIGLATDTGDDNDGTGLVSSGTAACAATSWGGDNNDLIITARQSTPDFNGVTISFQACAPGAESFTYDPVAKTMLFEIDPGTTRANDLIGLFQADLPAMADFAIALDPEDGSPNDGMGAVWLCADIPTAGGSSDTPVQTAGGAADGADFTITRSDGVVLEIDVVGAETIGDILDLINNHPDNLATGIPLEARLANSGNGIELVDDNPAGGTLTVTCNQMSTAAVDLGLVPADQQSSSVTFSAGESGLLTGEDVNPQETEGLFTALLRLYEGLLANDLQEIQRAVDMLDQGTLDLNFSRAELGARQQSLDVLEDRLDSQEIELQAALSEEYDADLVETASNLVARQLAYEASLRVIAQILQMSLLDYL